MSINTIDQFILFKRLFIIFGSICFLWLIIGCIFLSMQTYRHIKKRTNLKYFHYNYSLKLPSLLLIPIEKTLKEDNIFYYNQNDDDDDGEQTSSICTSISFISQRSKIFHEHTNFISSCQQIPKEQFELTFLNTTTTTTTISNLSYNQSTLTSSNNSNTSLFYYPTGQNFTYFQSTLSSSKINFHEKISQSSSLIIPLNNSSSSIDQFNLKHQLSQSSTSQITNTTYLSSQSSIKTKPLPTVMITDVDRLHTDIIELENFEPEKDCHYTKSQLKYLLNDRIPQTIK
ncbi:unnamed protein product [Rotaria sordida]|uniref:Uncharacterized protein n=1 Tax=Rotaria sordida TaxID=392033 RepID=A0A818IMF2_9BILA|nr:unnamed protein product [Rotaria sordida]CAF3523857.1 unnamed protein product [Rotaria sordida]